MAPTRARHTVLYFTFALSVITYLDRVAISSAATAIRRDLHLDAVQMAWVFSAFTFAYAAFEIPSGRLGDVFGPRKVLTRIVLWWSGFTMATGLAWNFASLAVARFLFGAGEAGAFPNISRSFARWFPTAERGHAHGIVFMGTRLGGAIAPPIVVMLIAALGWRETFYVFGAIGVVWCLFWRRWFTDDPAGHPAVNAEDLAHIQGGSEAAEAPEPFPWRELLSRNMALICGMHFARRHAVFNLTWLPTYLQDARGFTAQQAGYLAGIVLFMGALANLIGGKLTDVLVRRYGLRVGRSIGGVTLPLSGALVLAAALTDHALTAAALLAVTMGVADLCLSACWSICHDVGGRHAGAVTGCMNMFGNIGAALFSHLGPEWVKWFNWEALVLLVGGAYFCGMLCWLPLNPARGASGKLV